MFVITRALSAWLAYDPDVYKGDTEVAGDVAIYHFYAGQILDGGQAPYADVKIEYPPGSLVFIALPYKLSSDEDTYRLWFIIEMIVVDALGAIALLVLGRRWGYRWGVWAWVFLIPFLGPIAHVRLDLVPAVLTMWAFERAAAGRWLESGAALGVGAAVKLYPIALVPILFVAARQRRQFTIGVVLPLIAVLVPYIGHFAELSDAVIGYQTGRGIQVESTWGLLLLFASHLGLDVESVYNFGAFHVASTFSRALDTLSGVLSAVVAGACYLLAFRRADAGDVRRAAVLSFGALSLLLFAAAVWSPQYLIWLIALACVTLAARGESLRYTAYVLAAAGIVSQFAYPFVYVDLLGANIFITCLLLARNVAVAVVGARAIAQEFPNLLPKRAAAT